MHFKLWRLLLAAVICALMAQVLYALDGVFFSLDYYKDPAYSPLWSKLMMPGEGAPPPSFYYLSLGFNFVGALIFTIVYLVLRKAVPGTRLACKGLMYGFLMFLIAGVSGAFAMILCLNLPLALIGIWTAEDLVIKLLSGMVVAGLNKS